MKKKIMLIGLSLVLSACSTQRFSLDNQYPSNIPTYEGTSHFIFWGIGQTKTVNPNELCGVAGVRNVDTHMSFVNGLLGGITLGIYAPKNYTIYCNTTNK